VSIAAFRRQMQLTLAPAAGVRGAAAVRAVRWIARRLVGADPAAAAAADFILVTMARSRAQQTPIAMNAAIGVAMVVASLVQLRDPGTPAHPASALLSIPLMLAFWAVVGFRAACFVPADAPASWTFRVNAPDMARSGWLAVRASMIALIVPPIVVAAALLALILDWRLALWHVAVTTGLTVALIEIAAPTIRFLPFTRPYVHGHARLRTRWPMYLFGMFVFSRAPAHTDVLLTHPAALATVCTALTIAIGALELAGRCRPRAWPPQSDDDDVNPDVFRIKVLDLGYGVD